MRADRSGRAAKRCSPPLHTVDGRQPQTAATMHAALAAGGGTWSVQTIYKTMRRMANDGILASQRGRFELVDQPPESGWIRT
jgi:hypothetical protein